MCIFDSTDPHLGKTFSSASQYFPFNLAPIIDLQPEDLDRPVNDAPEEISFLMDDDLWKNIGTRQIHVHFLPTYNEGRWVGRIGITCPSKSTNSRGLASIDGFALRMSNKKSQIVHDIVDVKHLLPAPPAKRGVECVSLDGDHCSLLATVIKINKKADSATLECNLIGCGPTATKEKWEEPLNNMCWVE